MALPCRRLGNYGHQTRCLLHRKLMKLFARNCSTAKFAECESRIFSGIQPTGVPHIGNYGGAIVNWVKLQKKFENKMLLSIVDLHAITVPQTKLRQNILELTACLLACGINPNQAILFQQSMVPQHTELAWMLMCLCSVPQIQRLPQWREKKATVKEPSVGLLTYPILQAADIMLYKSTLVPVGEDQVHHIQLTNNLCQAFNRDHGVIFPHCEMLPGDIRKIRSLRNPGNKMSKSEANTKGRIDLLDSPEVVGEKIKKAVTDFTSEVTYDPENRPGVSNLIEIHSVVTDMFIEEIVEESFLLAEDTAMYKTRLASVVNEHLSPIRERAVKYLENEEFLWDVLRTGAQKASVIAESTIEEVKETIGMS